MMISYHLKFTCLCPSDGEEIEYSLELQTDKFILVEDIKSFVENEFISRDSLAFRKNLDKVTPDVDMTHYFECSQCGHEASLTIPLSVEFFWPRV